jgi:hypothetical protein
MRPDPHKLGSIIEVNLGNVSHKMLQGLSVQVFSLLKVRHHPGAVQKLVKISITAFTFEFVVSEKKGFKFFSLLCGLTNAISAAWSSSKRF